LFGATFALLWAMTAILDNLYSQENYLISKKLLDATHLRHETLANNLANVETPGFKRRDLPKNFSVELRRAADRKDFGKIKEMYPRSKVDFDAKPVRMDGNTVQLENELLEMNRNALNYEYLSGAVSGSIKELNLAIKGRV
jgi:flagellar basal-body rod protein FlgB